jgi:hypothetical protein
MRSTSSTVSEVSSATPATVSAPRRLSASSNAFSLAASVSGALVFWAHEVLAGRPTIALVARIEMALVMAVGPNRTRVSQNTQPLELRFNALLSEEASYLELAIV